MGYEVVLESERMPSKKKTLKCSCCLCFVYAILASLKASYYTNMAQKWLEWVVFTSWGLTIYFLLKAKASRVIIFSYLQVETVDDYDEYCHYVAGLVGLGLSKLFYAAGLEDLASDSLSNSMGLFLQVSWTYKL